MKSAVALRHVGFEDLDAFAPLIRDAGFSLEYRDIGERRLCGPELVKTDLLIILGGPISAYQDDVYPFLREELGILEQRLEAGRPTMGICLGAQLLARAAGARVFPGSAKEIGFAPISLTNAGRASCLAGFAKEPITLHWHGDEFDLPEGAERLAFTEACRNQAFSIGANVIGFQFHPEASAKNIEKWLIGHAAELAAAGIDIPRLRADAMKYGKELERKARRVVSDWLTQLQW